MIVFKGKMTHPSHKWCLRAKKKGIRRYNYIGWYAWLISEGCGEDRGNELLDDIKYEIDKAKRDEDE